MSVPGVPPRAIGPNNSLPSPSSSSLSMKIDINDSKTMALSSESESPLGISLKSSGSLLDTPREKFSRLPYPSSTTTSLGSSPRLARSSQTSIAASQSASQTSRSSRLRPSIRTISSPSRVHGKSLIGVESAPPELPRLRTSSSTASLASLQTSPRSRPVARSLALELDDAVSASIYLTSGEIKAIRELKKQLSRMAELVDNQEEFVQSGRTRVDTTQATIEEVQRKIKRLVEHRDNDPDILQLRTLVRDLEHHMIPSKERIEVWNNRKKPGWDAIKNTLTTLESQIAEQELNLSPADMQHYLLSEIEATQDRQGDLKRARSTVAMTLKTVSERRKKLTQIALEGCEWKKIRARFLIAESEIDVEMRMQKRFMRKIRIAGREERGLRSCLGKYNEQISGEGNFLS